MTATAAEGNPTTAAECIELAKAPMREIYQRGYDMTREHRLEELAVAQVWATLAGAYASLEVLADLQADKAEPEQEEIPTVTRGQGTLFSIRLTTRENQILNLLANGNKRAEVAGALGISEHTLRTHAQNILTKVGATSLVQAIALVRDEMQEKSA